LLRKQIAEQFGIHPWSFVIGRIQDEDLEELYCRNRLMGDICE